MSETETRIAVVLFNLGGPDRQESIRPFLFNFFMDPNIIRAPWIVRRGLAELISRRRSKKEAGTSYGELGNKSPLLDNSIAQGQALENLLNEQSATGKSYKTFVCMRYWHPMAPEVAENVKNYNPDHIVLLPLYPQFSTTTTWSSLGEWQKAAKHHDLESLTSLVCCYPWEDGFIQASAENIRKAYETMLADHEGRDIKTPRVLLSAHGLPESIVRDGDPYQWQCEQTARQIVEQVGIENLDWQICYQSRVGPMKWIGPSTEDALEKAAEDNVPLLVYPHAFVNEHVETLVEIEIEYAEMAEEMGIPAFRRVDTVGTNPAFISGLARLVRQAAVAPDMYTHAGGRICPSGYTRCCMGSGVRLSGTGDIRVTQPDHDLEQAS